MKTIRRNEKAKTFLAIVILVLCEAFFFRNILGKDSLVGDRGDGRLTNLLAEHWWRFFQGKEKFAELLMFYPAQGVLGYTDLLLGHGLIYSVFRLAGLNLFAAYKFTLVAMHSMGVASMFYLLRKKLDVSYIWAVFGTIAFCCSDTLARHIAHTQLLAVSMLPLLLILFIGFVQNFENRKKRNLYAYAFMLWFALLTYTAWYVAFFTGMFCLVFLLVSAVRMKWERLSVWELLRKWVVVLRHDFFCYVLFLVVIYIPFIFIYLPVLQSSSGYSYHDVCDYLPEIIDLVNVTSSNFMLGWFMKILHLEDRGYSSEVTEGFSCILLILFFTMMIVQKKKSSKQNKNDGIQTLGYEFVIESVVFAVIVCFMLVIRFGSNGVSLWAVVYYIMPMARSVRAVARFLLWLSFPIAVFTAYCANRYLNIQKKKWIRMPIVWVILLFISNINSVGVDSKWSAQEELAFLENISAPPEDANCFYIVDSKKMKDDPYIYQLDAFEIATFYSIRTINGYSGQFPVGWEGIWDICSDLYERSVYEWIRTNKLENVYAYDRAVDGWISSEDRIASQIEEVFLPAENKFSVSQGLEDFNQGEFAWTAKEFMTTIKNSKIQDHGLKIKILTTRGYYMIQNPNLVPYIKLYVDGKYIRDLPVKEGYAEYVILMQDHISDEYRVELKTNCFFNPQKIGVNEDTRNLSMALYYIGN